MLKASEERLSDVMDACGMDQNRRKDIAPPEPSVEGYRWLQRAFWHSGLNAAAVPRDSGKVMEGPGGYLGTFEGRMLETRNPAAQYVGEKRRRGRGGATEVKGLGYVLRAERGNPSVHSLLFSTVNPHTV